VGRFPTTSGEVVRHGPSLAGNRKLDYALHMVAVCQARSDARGGAYHYLARRSLRANPARRRRGASRGAFPTPSSSASWRIRRRLRAAPLDKEEPRRGEAVKKDGVGSVDGP
jgi:hypothetical protein